MEYKPNGKTCYFDKSDKALRAVKRVIKNSCSITTNEYGAFKIHPSKKRKYYLSQYLYGVYHGKPLSWVRNGRVNFLDRNRCNLTSANLSHTHANEPENINRRIWRDGDYIFLYHKKSGKVYFTDYEEELFKLLCNRRILWGYLPDLGRLRATVMDPKTKRKMDGFTFGFHTLVYCYYHYGARYRNFIGCIRKMQKDLQKNGLAIDHLDSNQEDNLAWNLSLMTRSQNSLKNNFSSRIRFPFFIFAVYINGKYRMVYGRVRGEILAPEFDAAFTICQNASDLVDFLRKFLETPWEDGLTPAQNYKDNPQEVCFHNYFGDFHASEIRKMLLEKDSSEFEIYEVKSDLTRLRNKNRQETKKSAAQVNFCDFPRYIR